MPQTILVVVVVVKTKWFNVLYNRAVPNILFVFYSHRIVGQIVYSYSAK